MQSIGLTWTDGGMLQGLMSKQSSVGGSPFPPFCGSSSADAMGVAARRATRLSAVAMHAFRVRLLVANWGSPSVEVALWPRKGPLPTGNVHRISC
jgi:hypothetical protein